MAQLRCMGCMREYSERKKKCPYCGYEKVCNPEYSFCSIYFVVFFKYLICFLCNGYITYFKIFHRIHHLLVM